MELATDFDSSIRLWVNGLWSGTKIYEFAGNGAYAGEIFDYTPLTDAALSGDGRFLVSTESFPEPNTVLSDLRNNITSKMDFPGMTREDRIMGVGLVGTDYSFADAEYSEGGLSVVVHTGRDENGTDLAILLWIWRTEQHCR